MAVRQNLGGLCAFSATPPLLIVERRQTFAAVRRTLDELLGLLLVGLGLGFLVRDPAAQAAGRTRETELETRSQERVSMETHRRKS